MAESEEKAKKGDDLLPSLSVLFSQPWDSLAQGLLAQSSTGGSRLRGLVPPFLWCPGNALKMGSSPSTSSAVISYLALGSFLFSLGIDLRVQNFFQNHYSSLWKIEMFPKCPFSCDICDLV